MASFDETQVITDPDQLTFTVDTIFSGVTTEIAIYTATKLIALKVTGNLTKDGATIKAVYSKLKDAWRANATLVKFPFPMGPITDEQYELINGWDWDPTETSGAATQKTTELLRTGGWSVVNTSGAVTQYWASNVTLGTLGSTDQVYYQQINSDTAAVDFKLTGKVNQAVQVLSDPNGDGSYVDGYDRRTFFKMFVREWQKLYAQAEIADIGVASMTYQTYRFPLTNGTDLKVTHLETAVGGGATTSGSWAAGSATINTTLPHGFITGDSVVIAGVTPAGYNGTFTVTYVDADTFTYTVADPTGVITVQGTATKEVYTLTDITYLRSSTNARYNIIGSWVNATVYAIGDVVKGTDSPAKWYKCTVAGTSSGTSANLAGGSDSGVTWVSYEGQREIGTGLWYAFDVIIDADTTVGPAASGSARTAEIYEAIQFALRQSTDIDASAPGSITGATANSLLKFVGDTLVTSPGVFIDSFNTQDTNAIEFYDHASAKITFPYVAALTINFGDNLQNDQYSNYWVFFTSDAAADAPAGNNFGTVNAIIVKDKDNADMTGTVNPAWPTKRAFASHSFNYDSNVQRGTGSAAKDAPITVVGIGLNSGQYVSSTGTIARSTANSVSLISSLERNYSQGTTYP